MKEKKKLTHNSGAPVADNQNVMTAGKKRPYAFARCMVP